MNKELELYELILLLKPVVTDGATTAAIESYREAFTERGSQVMIKNHGKRSLAYPIKGFETATFVQFVYYGNGTLIKELATEIHRDESVLRAITTKVVDENVSNTFAQSL